MIIYRGPSMLDGQPIVCIATGFDGARNEKTGAGLIQLYILRDGIHPVDAAQTGADASICGSCTHRGRFEDGQRVKGSRTCYVNLGQGVNVVWQAYQRGIYSTASHNELPGIFAGRGVRFGAYGDAAALPEYILRAIAGAAAFWTAYTHQWRDARFQYLRAWFMASADSEADATEAQAMGWRTFRVSEPVGWSRMPGEGLCPASAEAGKRTTCDKCGLCSGVEGKGKASIMIPRHDTGANAAKRRAGILPAVKRNPAVRVSRAA